MTRHRILVVDDRPSIVEVLRLFLQMRGYETREAFNGNQALAAMRKERPDLVLLDLVIPERTGFEVLRIMKEDPELRSIPVIVMTARSEVGDLPAAGLEGASGLIKKPFDLEEVADAIAGTLARAGVREAGA
ncbi:MAG: response regulator [Chitinophagales bacterium]